MITRKHWNKLFENDYWEWLNTNKTLIEENKMSMIDRTNLAVLLAEKKENEQRDILGSMRPLIAHLLKIKHWKRGANDDTRRDWQTQIDGFRQKFLDNFDKNEIKGASAKKRSKRERYASDEAFSRAYSQATSAVEREYKRQHGISMSIPTTPEFDFYQIIDPDFYNGDMTPPKQRGRKR